MVIELDDNDLITKVEDRWNGHEHATRYGAFVRVIHSYCDVYHC